MGHRLAPAVLAVAAALAPSHAAAQTEAIEPTFQLDRKQDVREIGRAHV